MAKKNKDVGAGRAKKKDTTAKDVKKLRETVEKLEARLEKAEKKAAKWKVAVRAERSSSAKLEAKIRRLQKERPLDHAPTEPSGDVPVEVPVTGAPDAGWTVTRLRALAREQGVAGFSRMTKAQLVEQLASQDATR